MMTRRTMIGAAAGAAGVAAAASATAAKAGTLPDRAFVHHVYFWLKQPDDPAARDALIAGLRKLATAPDLLWSHIGVPAPSPRGVVDGSYSVSWLTFFTDREAEERYQVDPIHLAFVKECEPLWRKVIVYDTEQVS